MTRHRTLEITSKPTASLAADSTTPAALKPPGEQMGVFTLPLTMLVDESGTVVNRSITVEELETELGKRLKRSPRVLNRSGEVGFLPPTSHPAPEVTSALLATSSSACCVVVECPPAFD